MALPVGPASSEWRATGLLGRPSEAHINGRAMGFARNEHINQPGPGSEARPSEAYKNKWRWGVKRTTEAHINGRAMGFARNEHINLAGPGSEARPSEAYKNLWRGGGEADNRNAWT